MEDILREIATSEKEYDGELLRKLIAQLRPGKIRSKKRALQKIKTLQTILAGNEKLRAGLYEYVAELFRWHDLVPLYSKSGILESRGFLGESWSRIKKHILPMAINRDLRTLIHLVFKKNDYLWLAEVPDEVWVELLQTIGFAGKNAGESDERRPLLTAIQLVSHHIATLGMDSEFSDKLPQLHQLNSPFLEQNKILTNLIDFESQASTQETIDEMDAQGAHIERLLLVCEAHIEAVRNDKHIHGTSHSLSQTTKRLLQSIKRLKDLMALQYDTATNPKEALKRWVVFGREVIRYESERNSIRLLMRDTLDLLAFETVEHAAKKGGHYIAENRKEYWKFFRASLFGGTLIAIFALLKIFLYGGSNSPFVEAFLFSVNYATCFVLVTAFGGIIATKQPAMTASAIARAIDEDGDGRSDNVANLAAMLVRLSRSQFISLAGNMLAAFTIACGIGWVLEWYSGAPVVSASKAESLFTSTMFSGWIIWYAATAGFFLAISGLISGYLDNKVVYGRIGPRIRQHPVLSRWIPKKMLAKMSGYIEKNMGVLGGNVALGFFLGMTAMVGFMVGLPLDIRHIAFSSGNFGYAMESHAMKVPLDIVYPCIVGLVVIGLVNFLVSFGVTLVIALRSRKTSYRQWRKLVFALLKALLRNPFQFFFPPRARGLPRGTD